jgi:thymidylate synthase (FAD)
MRVIPPSYEVLTHLDQETLAVRIEYCGRICYKSEDKINQESAIPFASKMAERGHNSVLEMGVVSLEVNCGTKTLKQEFFCLQPRFIQIDETNDNRLLITGSIRAFRELLICHPKNKIVAAMGAFLHSHHPYFFQTIIAGEKLPKSKIEVRKVELSEVDKLPDNLKRKHRYLAVKFIINRAITHEIVRHRICSFLQESQRYCSYANNRFGQEVTFIKPMFFKEDSPQYNLWLKAMLETENVYLQLIKEHAATAQAARTVLPNSCKTELIVYANLEEWQHIFKLRTVAGAEPSMREVMIPLHDDFKNRFTGLF